RSRTGGAGNRHIFLHKERNPRCVLAAAARGPARTRDGHFPVDIERCAVPEVHQPGAGDGKVSVYVRGYVFVEAQSTAAAEIQISVDVKRGVPVKVDLTRAPDGQ